jgi:hypothetical protein
METENRIKDALPQVELEILGDLYQATAVLAVEAAETTAGFLTATRLAILCKDYWDRLDALDLGPLVMPQPSARAPKRELIRLLTCLVYGQWLSEYISQAASQGASAAYLADLRAAYRQVLSAGIGVYLPAEKVDWGKVDRLRRGYKVPGPNKLADPYLVETQPARQPAAFWEIPTYGGEYD